MRGTSGVRGGGLFALIGLLLLVVAVEAVLIDVVDDLVGNVVANALASLPEEADLGGRYVVLDELGNNANVLPVLLEADKGIIWGVLAKRWRSIVRSLTNICTAAFKDESAIVTQNPAEILARPESGSAHGLDQVGTCKQRDMNRSLLATLGCDAAHDIVQFVCKVVQDLDGRQVLLVQRLPWINANPLGTIFDGDPCHVDPVLSGSQARLLVCITDRAEEAADDFVFSLKLAVVGRFLEHAQMQVGRW